MTNEQAALDTLDHKGHRPLSRLVVGMLEFIGLPVKKALVIPLDQRTALINEPQAVVRFYLFAYQSG